jgi:hypothetical protein
MKTCRRCILPSTAANIEFDSEGVCNYCRTYEHYRDLLTNFEHLRPLLLDRIDRFRGKYEYDCMIGLSGGKDSSYVAYRLVKEYKLKALLYTYDNGFLSDYALQNIRQVVEKLGMDHVLFTPDQELQQAIYKSTLKLFGIPCIGCTFSGMAHMVKVAIDKDIPLIFHGRSRAQMFKELTEGATDVFLPFLYGNFQSYDTENNRKFLVSAVKRIIFLLKRLVPQKHLKKKLRENFIPDIERVRTSEYAPEAVGLFLYERYDEDHIKNTLQNNLGWKRSDTNEDFLSHEDCLIHSVASHLYTIIQGQPMLCQELSTMIREGDIIREKALSRVNMEEFANTYSPAAIAYLSNMTAMGEERIIRLARFSRMRFNLMKVTLKALYSIRRRPRLPIAAQRVV